MRSGLPTGTLLRSKSGIELRSVWSGENALKIAGGQWEASQPVEFVAFAVRIHKYQTGTQANDQLDRLAGGAD